MALAPGPSSTTVSGSPVDAHTLTADHGYPVRLIGRTLQGLESALRRVSADGYVGGIVLFVGLSAVWVLGLSLAVASNLEGVVLCVVLLAGAGTLFYKLIRAMARLQMPEPPSRDPAA